MSPSRAVLVAVVQPECAELVLMETHLFGMWRTNEHCVQLEKLND